MCFVSLFVVMPFIEFSNHYRKTQPAKRTFFYLTLLNAGFEASSKEELGSVPGNVVESSNVKNSLSWCNAAFFIISINFFRYLCMDESRHQISNQPTARDNDRTRLPTSTFHIKGGKNPQLKNFVICLFAQ